MSIRSFRPAHIVAFELECAERYQTAYIGRPARDEFATAVRDANDREIEQLRAELATCRDEPGGDPMIDPDRERAALDRRAGERSGRLSVVEVPTPSGGWVISWFPRLQSFTAAHFAGRGSEALCTRLYGAAREAIPTVEDLERRLDFRLPASAVVGLYQDRAAGAPDRESPEAFDRSATDEWPVPGLPAIVDGVPADVLDAETDEAARPYRLASCTGAEVEL